MKKIILLCALLVTMVTSCKGQEGDMNLLPYKFERNEVGTEYRRGWLTFTSPFEINRENGSGEMEIGKVRFSYVMKNGSKLYKVFMPALDGNWEEIELVFARSDVFDEGKLMYTYIEPNIVDNPEEARVIISYKYSLDDLCRNNAPSGVNGLNEKQILVLCKFEEIFRTSRITESVVICVTKN